MSWKFHKKDLTNNSRTGIRRNIGNNNTTLRTFQRIRKMNVNSTFKIAFLLLLTVSLSQCHKTNNEIDTFQVRHHRKAYNHYLALLKELKNRHTIRSYRSDDVVESERHKDDLADGDKQYFADLNEDTPISNQFQHNEMQLISQNYVNEARKTMTTWFDRQVNYRSLGFTHRPFPQCFISAYVERVCKLVLVRGRLRRTCYDVNPLVCK